MLESEVEQYLVSQVKSGGGQAHKIKFIGRRGAPDRLVITPAGAMWLIELKRPVGGRLSFHQKDFIDNLPANTQYVLLWTMEQVDAWAGYHL